MTWPFEMSRLINEYAGYIQTEAQIARDEAIEMGARLTTSRVIKRLNRVCEDWQENTYVEAMAECEAAWRNYLNVDLSGLSADEIETMEYRIKQGTYEACYEERENMKPSELFHYSNNGDRGFIDGVI